jgi:hypothetical protein
MNYKLADARNGETGTKCVVLAHLFGTLVNTAAIITGSCIELIFKKNLPDKYRQMTGFMFFLNN